MPFVTEELVDFRESDRSSHRSTFARTKYLASALAIAHASHSRIYTGHMFALVRLASGLPRISNPKGISGYLDGCSPSVR